MKCIYKKIFSIEISSALCTAYLRLNYNDVINYYYYLYQNIQIGVTCYYNTVKRYLIMESRIKKLREKRGLIQEILAAELGITQQLLSKYERDITIIKVDILKRIAKYFNVTTDYLLGISDLKRDLQGQMKMSETLDEYYDLIEVYKELDKYDREVIWSIMQAGKKANEKRKKEEKTKEVENKC